MRAYLNQTLVVPFPANQSVTAVTITVMKLSNGTLVVNGAAMTQQSNNIWAYNWTTPRVVEQYQVIFDDGSFPYTGPIIEVGGGEVFTVQADAGNTAGAFKTNLTEATNDHYVQPALVRWLTGVLAGQTRRLASTGAFNGTTKFLTVGAAFTATPADGMLGVLITG